MARLTIAAKWTGIDDACASFQSICTALSNAHVDVHLDMSADKDGIAFQGMRIASVEMGNGPDASCFMLHLKPTASMILFANWLMTLLPSTATLRWQGGWPHITCPPNDDRDHIDDPTPLVPNMLEPV